MKFSASLSLSSVLISTVSQMFSTSIFMSFRVTVLLFTSI